MLSLRQNLCRGIHTGPLVETLKARGLISQITSESFDNVPEKTKLGVYLGADPTASSLHLGNLMPFMVLMHFYIRGHKVFPLIGGATGVVGDPSGRKTERATLAAQQRDHNISLISEQMKTILQNCRSVAAKYYDNVEAPSRATSTADPDIEPVNNYTWWKDINMLWFLGTFGRFIRVSSMLARESVKQRLKSEAGLGYNEFSYQILQAYDFFHLYTEHNCHCQIGGHDQWGNITAGVELINRLVKSQDQEPVGLTVPLLTTPNGEKFGKSAGNAVFLSAEQTKPYHLFQYLVKSPDETVENYLKLFTFIPLPEIEKTMAQHNVEPQSRIAQHRLAMEVTELVHGRENAESAMLVSSVMFGSAASTAPEILAAFKSQGLVHETKKSDLIGGSYKTLLADLSGRSKSEAQRLIKNGSVYIGTSHTVLDSLIIEEEHLEASKILLIRVGKTEYYVVEALS